MDGVILINKEQGETSRDVVNKICKKLNTRKVGHTGTLDPLASGLMVICLNEGLKLVELLTGHDKEYLTKVRIGLNTDTYDITGIVLEEKKAFSLSQSTLEKALSSFLGTYEQEVPKYSAVKVKGKKLYEYARRGLEVSIPKHQVTIKEISLIEYQGNTFTFKVTVSSGTYIRSLINDLGKRLQLPMTMEELTRIRVGKFRLEDASSLEHLKVLSIQECLDMKKIEVNETLLKKISNGVKIPDNYHEDYIMFTYQNKPVSIYKREDNFLKSYRVFQR